MQDLWSAALPHVRQQVGDRNFLAWIEPIRCTGTEPEVRLEVPSRFFQDWVTRHFLSTITETVDRVAGHACAVRLVVNESATAQPLVFDAGAQNRARMWHAPTPRR
jgi:chromosomal replication initiation ATPase DnaA